MQREMVMANIVNGIRPPQHDAYSIKHLRFYRGEFMRLIRLISSLPLAALILPGTGYAQAQEFPGKAIRIVASPPGGANNFIARLVAQGLTDSVGWQVIVDNRPSGFIQGEIVARSAPDGYSMLIAAGSFTVGPLLEKAPYDPVKDFAPVVLVATSPNIVVVHPSLPVKSITELITLAKSRPGQLNYGAGSTGSSGHLASELLKSMARADIVRINYKGDGPAVVALLGGEIQTMVVSGTTVAQHIKSGRMRALAVTSPRPTALFPGLPTVAASVPGYEFVTPFGLLAAAQTPRAVIARLNQAIVRLLSQPEIKQKFFDAGTEVVANSPDEYAAMIKSEIVTWSKLIKETGISAQ